MELRNACEMVKIKPKDKRTVGLEVAGMAVGALVGPAVVGAFVGMDVGPGDVDWS